jgi:hypothetical protein
MFGGIAHEGMLGLGRGGLGQAGARQQQGGTLRGPAHGVVFPVTGKAWRRFPPGSRWRPMSQRPACTT